MKNSADGKIVTFYSYKGGVGRTMSLANVAFLAALNGQRVLVMDWDLEAPGLAYYFRGLLEAQDAKQLKDQPGILDILWEWGSNVKNASTQAQLDETIKSASSGVLFENTVRSLLYPGMFSKDATLDYIGAGSRLIATPTLLPYEEALASFSWSRFFDHEGGGLLLDSLKNWAKSHYDLVLIDSRTGLADVAGICTMQLPDVVALCFVLNRQNIDGVAKVAAAIRTKRSEEIAVRAVPMRVSRRDTSEESDARARAIAELTRVGGFSLTAAQGDMSNLSVAADENVPFYETLAPFTATDPALDPLTLNYMRLATNILDCELELPTFDKEVVATVRRRLLPRKATVEYISKLKTFEPERAFGELQHLLESAFEAELEGEELNDEYLRALVETVDSIDELWDSPFQSSAMRNKGLDLLRILSINKPDIWKQLLLEKIEDYVELYSFLFESEEELSLLEELDSLYADYPTLSIKLRRIFYRRKAARLFVVDSDVSAAMQTVGEILSFLHDITQSGTNLAADQQEQVLAANVDIFLLRGDVSLLEGKPEEAYKEFKEGLEKLSAFIFTSNKEEALNLSYELNFRLAEAPPPYITDKEAAMHAVEAAISARATSAIVLKFRPLANAVMRDFSRPDNAVEFCQAAFSPGEVRLKSYMENYYGRSPAVATVFFETTTKLINFIAHATNTDKVIKLGQQIADITVKIIRNLDRRRQTVGSKQRDSLSRDISELKVALETIGTPLDLYTNLGDVRYASRTPSRRPLENNADE